MYADLKMEEVDRICSVILKSSRYFQAGGEK